MWPNSSRRAGDPGLIEVIRWFHGHGDLEEIFGRILRQAFDEVLDGRRTGRYDVRKHLEKTEKTYLGTKVEILVRTELGIQKGQPAFDMKKPMDYIIAGQPVDAKFSIYRNGWNIPKEAIGHLCLLIHADDQKQRFEVGLLRIEQTLLRAGPNQDSKKGIAAASRGLVSWLVEEGRLPPNLLLHMDDDDRRAVLGAGSGQARVTEVFRRVQGLIITREALEPIAKQLDMPKRVRDSRSPLAVEGIAILGGQEKTRHSQIAGELGLPAPRKGEWISVRLVPDTGDGRPSALVSGQPRVIAKEGDAPVSMDPRY